MTQKDQFRITCQKELQKTSDKKSCFPHKNINQLLYQYIIKNSYKRILFYIPFKYEVNVHSLIKKLRRKRIELFVPFMHGVSFKMVPYRLPLYKKRFGIYEPNKSNKRLKPIDLAIVPVLGVDETMRRVGFGKGMYDRFFQTQDATLTTIFIQIKRCESNTIVTHNHDVKANYYVTPNRFFDVKRRQNVIRSFYRR
jgi:5-formyltetrahydrofolate cyclo-ligase